MIKNPEVWKSVSMYVFINLDVRMAAKMFYLCSKKIIRSSLIPVLLSFNF